MKMNLKVLEWFGVITAIAYSLFVASNVGLEFLGFVLLFISAISIGAWAYLGGHRGILLLQFFLRGCLCHWHGALVLMIAAESKSATSTLLELSAHRFLDEPLIDVNHLLQEGAESGAW